MVKDARTNSKSDDSGTKYHEVKTGHIPGYGLVDENAKMLLNDDEESK
ncbi:hypothetical protein [Peribacillus loiseleuriae]|nr:hypothetical protein [Peribacillus loiseleuriae]